MPFRFAMLLLVATVRWESISLAGVCSTRYRSLLVSGAPTILSVEREISDSGGSHAGVYVVTTDRGPMALKVRNTHTPISPEALDVQRELASRGLAPGVHGVIEGAALEALWPELEMKQQKRFPRPSKSAQGILMDMIPNGWNCPSWESSLPVAAVAWDKDAILRRIEAIEKALTEMNVLVLIPQVLIDESGKAYLIDIEKVSRGSGVRGKPFRTDLTRTKEAFLDAWKRRFGNH